MAMVTVTTMAMAMSDGDDGDDRLKEQIHPNDIIIIIIISVVSNHTLRKEPP